jgi:hypothetical protein
VTLFVGQDIGYNRKSGPQGPGAVAVRDRIDGEFTNEQIDDAICMVAGRYGRMVQDGQLEFCGSTESVIQAAAKELVAEQYLAPELAEIVVPQAMAFVARSGRRSRADV